MNMLYFEIKLVYKDLKESVSTKHAQRVNIWTSR